MSELFLDTDIAPSLAHVERVLRASPFTGTTLERILLDEVGPVCLPNLMQVAGVWSGFREEWLIAEIERHLAKPAPLAAIRRPFRRRALRRLVPEWDALRDRLSD